MLYKQQNTVLTNMRDTVNILGVNIDNLTAAEALEKARKMLLTASLDYIFTPNPEIIMIAKKDEEFRNILNTASICTADGIGVVYAAKSLGSPIPERVAGFDLALSIMNHLNETGDGIFLFGAKPGVAITASEKLKEMFPKLNVCGTHNGYFKEEDSPHIVNEINNSGAKLLLVCLGAPKQEKWIFANREKLKVNLCLGVGGTLDVIAGNVKRAPDIFIKLNLEWFYRLLKQPSRFMRYMEIPKFMLAVRRFKKSNL